MHASSNSKVPNSFSLVNEKFCRDPPSTAGRVLGEARLVAAELRMGMDGWPDSLLPSLACKCPQTPSPGAPFRRHPLVAALVKQALHP